MRIRVVASSLCLAFVLAGGAPTAHAKPAFCQELRRLAGDLPRDFANVRSRSMGNGFFWVDNTLPGSPKCTVFVPPGVPMMGVLSCNWPLEGDGNAQLARLKKNVLACAPKANSGTVEIPGSKATGHVVVDPVVRYEATISMPLFKEDAPQAMLRISTSRGHALQPK